MLLSSMLAALLILRWIVRLGGPGLVLLGIADNSVVPLVGSMDVLTIWLAASQRGLWFYYAIMATIGAVVGGYITYALGRKGGQEAIEHKLDKKKAEKITKRFERWGFWTVFTSALLPPPFPLVPVLLAAGATQYSRKKFVGALSAGRGVRYLIVAGMGAMFGDSIVSFFSRYYMPALFTLIGLAVIGTIATIFEYRRAQHRHKTNQNQKPASQQRVA